MVLLEQKKIVRITLTMANLGFMQYFLSPNLMFYDNEFAIELYIRSIEGLVSKCYKVEDFECN